MLLVVSAVFKFEIEKLKFELFEVEIEAFEAQIQAFQAQKGPWELGLEP